MGEKRRIVTRLAFSIVQVLFDHDSMRCARSGSPSPAPIAPGT
jgi:hypothetical protein